MASGAQARLLARFAPGVFVFLWSTGFIGAKYGLPHAQPLTFLVIRYALVILLMALAVMAFRARWPRTPADWLHIGISGLLVHGVYLGGVYMAIAQGLPAGVSSLVVGLQPLLTVTVVGLLLGERVGGRQWLGLVFGLIGTAMVLSSRIQAGFGSEGLAAAAFALLGITLGTVYQKRFCPVFDFRTGAVIQFVPVLLATGLVAWQVEAFEVTWTAEFMFALAWLVVVLSIGAIFLLNYLIRSATAVNVASLFYLVPPTTALIAWSAFGEALSGVALAGMGIAVWGVYLVRGNDGKSTPQRSRAAACEEGAG